MLENKHLGGILKSLLLSHNTILRFPFSVLPRPHNSDKLCFLWNITFPILSHFSSQKYYHVVVLNIQTQLPKLSFLPRKTVVKNCSYSSFPCPPPPHPRLGPGPFCRTTANQSTQTKIVEFCLVDFKETGKLEKTVKPQFHHSHNPAATQIAYHGRRFHIIDVTFTPHLSKTIAEKKKLPF